MCDKKNNVLFTETGCLILSPDFKLLDESQVLLKVPRQDNMYSFDLKNVVPSGEGKATQSLLFSWVFFLATKDETSGILKTFITGIENQINHKVKIIRCDNGTEFKNNDMNQFCGMKGIKREFSVARTPQQNGAEAVNTACYVQNRVLVTKPHNKTPYELLLGRPPSIRFMRPFGCPVTIFNILDPLGKFDGKADEGFLVGYSINSKDFRVFNTRSRKVEENLHIKFLENKPNVAGSGPEWPFDIDSLTKSMNYEPVTIGNQTNGDAGIDTNVNAGQAGQEKASDHEYILLPLMLSNSPLSSSTQSTDDKDANEVPDKGDDDVSQRNGQEKEGGASNKEDDQHVQDFRAELDNLLDQQKEGYANNTNRDSTASPSVSTAGLSINTASENINTGSPNINTASPIPNDSSMQSLENTGIFDDAYDDREVGAEADLNNLETTMNVSPIPTTRIHKDHPKDQIIRDINSTTQTKRMIKISEEHAMASYIKKQRRTNHKDYQNCLFAYFLSQIEPKKKQGKTGCTRLYPRRSIDYDKVFAPVAMIEAISYFALCILMGFIVYQMDVKSAFLYGTIEKEVYVCQPSGFEDPQFPDKVYKVEKALYGLYQAPRAWYETLSTYLLENRFRRGTIDKTLFIKKDKGDIVLVQVYVDDIIFGFTKKSLCLEFKQIIHKRFQMSFMGELTFFLGLQTSSTSMEPNKALVKDEEADNVDVHLYRSMIGSLMYLTTSRPDIIFVVCACTRFQVTPKVSHLHVVKRIFRYIKGPSKLGLWYPKDSPFDLKAFSNTEYVAAANCCRQVLWNQNQMLDYGFNFMNTKIYIDNKNTICIVKNLKFHAKTKHIEIRHNFINDSYEKRLIQVTKVHSDHNVADLLTNAFDVSRLSILSIWQIKRGQDTKIPQSSGPPKKVGDKAVHKELGDRMERAATTASSLEVEQDSGNINRTQSMATLNELSP
ncbi:putative ribonuclease H-like domain-containing protein [Tanacetum coccineum]